MKEIRKYLIGFIIGLLSIGTLTYAADNGSIGFLFEKIGGSWFLKGENIENYSIAEIKLDNSLGIKIDKIGTNSTDIAANSTDIAANRTDIAAITENVNADWNSTTGGSQILNKPLLPDFDNTCSNSSDIGNVKNDLSIGIIICIRNRHLTWDGFSYTYDWESLNYTKTEIGNNLYTKIEIENKGYIEVTGNTCVSLADDGNIKLKDGIFYRCKWLGESSKSFDYPRAFGARVYSETQSDFAGARTWCSDNRIDSIPGASVSTTSNGNGLVCRDTPEGECYRYSTDDYVTWHRSMDYIKCYCSNCNGWKPYTY